jgi:hypothetical protein
MGTRTRKKEKIADFKLVSKISCRPRPTARRHTPPKQRTTTGRGQQAMMLSPRSMLADGSSTAFLFYVELHKNLLS